MTAPTTAHFLTVEELADLLRVPVSTVYRWRTTGTGPRASRVGRYLRYSRREIDRWLDQNTA